MTRQQRLVILAMALVDFLVIGGLASYVVSFNTPSSPSPLQNTPQPTPNNDACAAVLLRNLTESGLIVTVQWDETESIIQVYEHVSGALTAHTQNEPVHQATEVPEWFTASSPQILWHVLDRLPHPLPDTCRIPETFMLNVCVRSDARQCYTLACQGTSLAAWLAQRFTDDEFAQSAHYRKISAP